MVPLSSAARVTETSAATVPGVPEPLARRVKPWGALWSVRRRDVVGEADVIVNFGRGALQNVDESLVFGHPNAKATSVPTRWERRTRRKR